MDYKWIGAILIISASGGFGFSLVRGHRREEAALRSLLIALDYMSSELHFHAPALSQLCRGAGKLCGRGVGQVFLKLADRLEDNQTPDAASCMDAVLEDCQLPAVTLENMRLLGASLGRFDLEGQLKGLEVVRGAAKTGLDKLLAEREQNMRNFQTLSLCAGAALVILLV